MKQRTAAPHFSALAKQAQARRSSTCLLSHGELLQDQERRAGALQAAPLQHLLQDPLAVVQRSLCGGGDQRRPLTRPSDRRPAANSPTPLTVFPSASLKYTFRTHCKNTPKCQIRLILMLIGEEGVSPQPEAGSRSCGGGGRRRGGISYS